MPLSEEAAPQSEHQLLPASLQADRRKKTKDHAAEASQLPSYKPAFPLQAPSDPKRAVLRRSAQNVLDSRQTDSYISNHISQP